MSVSEIILVRKVGQANRTIVQNFQAPNRPHKLSSDIFFFSIISYCGGEFNNIRN